ncbi:MAG TPA: SDR family oxidoreductase [Ramlibacter sp.]|nr:SDR family oxidoreductase [Ramlibacter sp.]
MAGSTPVAVVTGGARGIGAAAARKFAALGHAVAILDVDQGRGDALARELPSARFHACDVGDAEAVQAVADRTAQELGPAAVLVTSAGLIPNTDSVLDMDLAAHDRMWRVNYHGTVHACRSFGRQMVAAGSGAIVTLGSINSLQPLPLPAYNAGKAAIARLTQLLAAELGRHHIRVNSVAPTYVMTPELQARIDAGQRDLAKMMSVHALDLLPTPADVAEAIAFLCSPAARTITGVLLPVDSGWASGVSYMSYAGGVPWDRI